MWFAIDKLKEDLRKQVMAEIAMVEEEKKKGEIVVSCSNDEKSKNDKRANETKPTLEDDEPCEPVHDIVWCLNCSTARHAKKDESHIGNLTHGWKKAKRKNRGKWAKPPVPKPAEINGRPGAETRKSGSS